MIRVAKIQLEKLSDSSLNRMYDILIHAYAETEVEVWGENYVRIGKDEFREIIGRGEFYGAFIEGRIVGSVRVYKKDNETYSFGLLSADFDLKGQGIGKALVDHIERFALDQGAKFMDLEILRPIAIEVPFKIVLKNWYSKLGYKYTHSGTFAELKPDNVEKADKLIQPCTFDCYRKVLN